MGLLWRLFAPRGLKKARRALHPSWVIEDAIVHSVRKGRRQRRRRARQQRRVPRPAPQRAQVQYGAQINETETGRMWRCFHDHLTEESARSCADAMEQRISLLGWEQATGDRSAVADAADRARIVYVRNSSRRPGDSRETVAATVDDVAPTRRQRYVLICLSGCLVIFIGAWIGINKAPPRSGLSYAMGWTMVVTFAGALLSLIVFLRGRRRVD